MDLKDAAEKARSSNLNRKKEELKNQQEIEEGGSAGCFLFLTLAILGIICCVLGINNSADLYQHKWLYYISFSAASIVGAIILTTIAGSVLPVFKVALPDVDESSEKELSPEAQQMKSKLLKALDIGGKDFDDKGWLFALALDHKPEITKEKLEKGIAEFSKKFKSVEYSSLSDMVFAIEFDDCHCHLMVNETPMPADFYQDTFLHCGFPKAEKERFLNHKYFINFNFHSKKKNPRVRYLQAYAVISCFRDNLTGILNSTVSGLFMPQTVDVIKEHKSDVIQPLCYVFLNEFNKGDGTSWYVSRGNFVFGFPDFAIIGASGSFSKVAVILNGILNYSIEKKLDYKVGLKVQIPGIEGFTVAEVYEHEKFIKMYGHEVVALIPQVEGESGAESDTAVDTQSISNSEEEEKQNQKMIEWIKNPAEFRRPPEEIKVARKINCIWPGYNEKVDVYFHEFKMGDGSDYLGISGPIEWAFKDSRIIEFSAEEQKWIFAGWMMTFLIGNGHLDGGPTDESHDELALQIVGRFEGVESCEIESKVNCLDGHLCYAVKVQKESESKYVLFELSNIGGGGFLEIDVKNWKGSELDPLYYCIGKIIFEGGVDCK